MALLGLGVKFVSEGLCVSIFLGNVFYSGSFISDGLIVLDIEYYKNKYVNLFSLIASINDDVCSNTTR